MRMKCDSFTSVRLLQRVIITQETSLEQKLYILSLSLSFQAPPPKELWSNQTATISAVKHLQNGGGPRENLTSNECLQNDKTATDLLANSVHE